MATPKILSDEEIQELLEDRQNGMGLQKVAKKYGVGIPKIRKLEKENGLEIVPAAKPTQLSIEDIQRHFQEVQESFAIVLDDLRETKEELQNTKRELLEALEKIAEPEEEVLLEEDIPGCPLEEELENLGKKIDWQIDTSTAFGIVGLAIGGFYLWMQGREQKKPPQYYRPPTPPTPKKKIPEME